jgi:hypothetical protein
MSKNLVRNVPKYGPKCPKIWSEMSGPKCPWSEMSYYLVIFSWGRNRMEDAPQFSFDNENMELVHDFSYLARYSIYRK